MRRRFVLLPIAAMALAASCGSSTEQTGDTSTTGAKSPGQTPTVPTVSTTTTAPKPTINNTPECIAFAQFSYAQTGMSFATPDQAAQIEGIYTQTANTLKEKLPQFSQQISTITQLTTKDVSGELSDTETSQLQEAFATLTAWNTETCVIPPS